MIKTIFFILLIFAQSITTEAKTNHPTLNEIDTIAKSYDNKSVQDNGTHLIKVITDRIKEEIIRSHINITKINTNKKNTTVTVNWFINKKRLVSRLGNTFKIYEGEKPSETKSSKKQGKESRNNLYFFDKPLGQDNGITFILKNKSPKQRFIKEVFTDIKIFIKVKHNNFEQYIPILTTTNKKGCGQNIFNKNATLLCIQTTNSKNNELNLGHVNGFTNELTIPSEITNINEITTTFEFFYKEHIL